MKVAILSDVHDHVWNLGAALPALGDTEALVFCGDLCSPFVVGLLAEGFANRPIHVVFGNNDGDLYRIALNAARHDHVQLHGEVFKGELGGRRFAVNHFPEIAGELAASGDFDVVCFGHDHRIRLERHGEALAINPGTLLGYEPGSRTDVPATFVVYDTSTHEAVAWQVVHDDAPGRRVVEYA
jgi:putative phosphoesterase